MSLETAANDGWPGFTLQAEETYLLNLRGEQSDSESGYCHVGICGFLTTCTWSSVSDEMVSFLSSI